MAFFRIIMFTYYSQNSAREDHPEVAMSRRRLRRTVHAECHERMVNQIGRVSRVSQSIPFVHSSGGAKLTYRYAEKSDEAREKRHRRKTTIMN